MTSSEKKYFAIEVIGYGKHQKYCIKQVIKNGYDVIIKSYDFKVYRTEESAKNAAANYNIEIKKIGDCYKIM